MDRCNSLSGKTFSILGDSYSTFLGYIPEDYACYYPRIEAVDDVRCVEDTWWHQLMRSSGMQILVNNSYSGSTVCTRVREDHPKTVSFVERVDHCAFSGAGGSAPDYIFVFGCTNDNWLDRPVGEVRFSDWTDAALEQVLPAYCYVLHRLSADYPKTEIVSIINTDLKPALAEGMAQAAEHYHAVSISLAQIDKKSGHPSALGMCQIAEQIKDILELSM